MYSSYAYTGPEGIFNNMIRRGRLIVMVILFLLHHGLNGNGNADCNSLCLPSMFFFTCLVVHTLPS